MNTTYGQTSGIQSIRETSESVIWWGRDSRLLYVDNLVVGSTAVDAGNSPTTELRAGLLMGKQTADSKLYQWDADAVDGTEVVQCVLLVTMSMLDVDGSVEDKYVHALISGPLKAESLFIEGTAFTTSTNEHLARRQMIQANKFIFDDESTGGAAFLGGALKNKQATGTTLTASTADNGTRYTLSNAASVTVTLPTIESGLIFEFLRTADEEFIVASAAGSDVIVGNDLSANGVTYTTAGQQIGATVRCETIFVGTTLKWLFTLPAPPFGTGTAALAYSIQT